MLPLQALHLSVQYPQKFFNRLLPVFWFESQGFGQLDLVFEVQLIAFAPCKMVQSVSNVSDE